MKCATTATNLCFPDNAITYFLLLQIENYRFFYQNCKFLNSIFEGSITPFPIIGPVSCRIFPVQKKAPIAVLHFYIPFFSKPPLLVEQAMVDYGNAIEKSPIVHPEIAGRGVEYAHGRAAYFYSSRCQGHLSEMERLVHRAYSTQNIPQELAAKFERRCNDYQRCYRMGVLSKDLEKMRAEIKTHRNMRDYHVKFINSSVADDDTDVHILNCKALSKILPQKLLAFSSAVTSPIFPCGSI